MFPMLVSVCDPIRCVFKSPTCVARQWLFYAQVRDLQMFGVASQTLASGVGFGFCGEGEMMAFWG